MVYKRRNGVYQGVVLTLYAHARIYLSRAAEMVNLDIESFKTLVYRVGIPYRVPAIGKESVQKELRVLSGRDAPDM